MRVRFLLAFALAVASLAAVEARPLAPEEVPDALKPWVPWVLHGLDDLGCPALFSDPLTRRCAWPSAVDLVLEDSGGTFEQSWAVYREVDVALPGDQRHWPQEVKIDAEATAVGERDGRPVLRLGPGTHRISGRFQWDRLPDALALPPDSGQVRLRVKGETLALPDLRPDGQLWLKTEDAGEDADRLDIQVFRRLTDEIPVEITTRLQLEVSGQERELALGGALLADTIPVQLESPLPARLEPGGALHLKLRPGRWVVEVLGRYPADSASFALAEPRDPWPRQEVWVFDARNHLRLVEVEGVPAVDPSQTTLPDTWKGLPAYRMNPGDTLTLKLVRRGDPEPEPDRLNLKRDLWLDFDGGGYTVADALTGTMTRGWRLTAGQQLALGRVAQEGVPQLITTLPGSDRPGVEVRRGTLDLDARSRLEGVLRSPPAVGWDQKFQGLSATLHLPPGWRLFAASGMDDATATWLLRWTLLDLFLVLLAGMAIGHLWGVPSGFLGLVALTLIWQEPAAPTTIWLHLCAATALVRVLPEGRWSSLARAYRFGAFGVLAVIALPFMVDQVRLALYPQLERPGPMPVASVLGGLSSSDEVLSETSAELEMGRASRERMFAKSQTPDREPALPATPAAPAAVEQPEAHAAADKMDRSPSKAATLTDEIDPKAKVQTGPGLPEWRWTEVALTWRGPVVRDQALYLMLIPPWGHLLMNLCGVVLLTLLAARMWHPRHARRDGSGGMWSGMTPALVIISLAGLGLPCDGARADFPDPKLLETLKERMTAPPDCRTSCAQIARAAIQITPTLVAIRLEIHSDASVAVPLPVNAREWMPSEVLLDEGGGAPLFRGPDGGLWARLSTGRHDVLVAGRPPPRARLTLPLPLRPHRVEVRAEGWAVEGIREDGAPEAQLQFTRLRTGAELPDLEPGALPGFARVDRLLHLGLDWRVDTEVRRLSPLGQALLMEVPLLPGESVTTEGVRVRDGKVSISLAADVEMTRWASVIADKHPELTLVAPQTLEWTERWRADVSPVWHLDTRGLAVVHHQDPNGRWLPEWRPWPGEALTLVVGRPGAIEGPTLTLKASRLASEIGQHATDSTLVLALESSQGGQHALTLPEDGRLLQVLIDGQAQPIRQEGRQVGFPVTPGERAIELRFRQDQGIAALFRTPELDLGAPSANHSLEARLGNNRWVLFVGGPALGPAVLFWGALAVVALLALGLGRTRYTPLAFRHWFLLGIGLSQGSAVGALLVAAWLLALGVRKRVPSDLAPLRFDTLQVALVVLTLLALGALFDAVRQGLLGLPEMQIAGNGSSASVLSWYQDRSDALLPRAFVLSVPLGVYRFLMLAWALWLAFALLRWLRWGWHCFTTGGLWKPRKPRIASPPAVSAEARSTAAPLP